MSRRTSPPAPKTVARLALIAVAMLIAFAITYRAQTKEIDFSALDKVVAEERRERNIPGAALAIVIGDRVVYAKGYGAASVETGVPVTPETLFRMGSTTKMFTAAALVTLAHEGRLKLEAPVGEYVKGLHTSLLKHEGAEQPLTKVGPHTFSSGAGQFVFVPGADGKAEHLFMGLYAARKVAGVSQARPAASTEQVARLKERLQQKLNSSGAAAEWPRRRKTWRAGQRRCTKGECSTSHCCVKCSMAYGRGWGPKRSMAWA